MKKPSLHSACALVIALALVGYALPPTALAQDSAGNIPLARRAQQLQATSGPSAGPSALRADSGSIKVDVNLVLVSVSVVDPLNREVVGLNMENFEVFERKEKQVIRHFSGEDAPISLGVIFDVSGSMADKIDRARDAVLEFFKIANPQDEFFMITFNDQPRGVTEFTQSVEDIAERLLYTVPKGRTALLDAIYLGLHKMHAAKYEKKALLIISDGGDNHSRYSESEIKSLVKESDVQVYSIGIYDHYFQTAEERLGPQLLSDISEITGGRAFSIENPNDLTDVAAKIGIELRNQYVLGYRPTTPVRDGKWHKLRVKVTPPKGLPPLKVYARAGYYASSE
jgi:Ca-activated chloride channel family protein